MSIFDFLDYKKRITELEAQVKQLTAELEAAQKECTRLSDYSVELLNANAELSHEKISLRMQLETVTDAYGKLEDAYSTLELGHKLMLAEPDGVPKPKETAPKPKRNSRAKPPAQE